MNSYKIGILFSVLLAIGLCSCKEQKSNEKLILNEVLVDNESNFQDDYGLHSAWVEVFNKSYGSANLAGWLLKTRALPDGDTVTYFIPKGDVLTNISPRQHALFWTDGNPRRGTFHTNFVLSKTQSNWIGLFDSGGKLIDQVTIPAGLLKPDQSFARVNDASPTWEVKDNSPDKYVTPSTNNKTIESNPKVDKFTKHDPSGLGMTASAMGVVFSGLVILYLCFRTTGKLAVVLRKKNAMKAQNVNDKEVAKERKLGEAPGEVMAAIAMALHEAQGADHDTEETILTIRVNHSPWSSKIHTLRETPHK